jgi:rhodanese-related sulfurtransferase
MPEMRRVDALTLRQWQRDGKDMVLLDVLPEAVFRRGHLPGAINIVSDDVIERSAAELPDKHRLIVVYCASARCKRAMRAAKRLEDLGYRNLVHFAGGKEEWNAEGLAMQGEEGA